MLWRNHIRLAAGFFVFLAFTIVALAEDTFNEQAVPVPDKKQTSQTADGNLENVLRELTVQQKRLTEILEKGTKKEKDPWDKFATISAFLSTIIIAVIGAIFTHVYNTKQSERNETLKQQEIRVAQIQTVEKFVPYLTGSEEQKKIAILALNSLGNTEVATKLAGLYPSEGTVAALKVIAKSGQEAERNLANQALQGIFDRQRKAVVQVAVDGPQLQPYASGALVSPSGYVVTADYAVTSAPNLDQGREKLRVITADGAAHKATVVGIDETSGLAVLKITSTNSPVLQLGNPTVRLGDSVLAIGSRGSLALEPAVGVVRGIDNRFVNVSFGMEIHGFGGGPVLNNEGLLIGMVHSLKPDVEGNVDQCVRSDIIRTYLRKLDIEPYTAME